MRYRAYYSKGLIKFNLARNLQKLRKNKKLSLEQLGNDLGVSKSFIWGLEKEKHMPSLYLAAKIATYFDVTIDTLAHGEYPHQLDDDNFFMDYRGLSTEAKKHLRELVMAMRKTDESILDSVTKLKDLLAYEGE